MIKLQAGERNLLANSGVWVANIIAFVKVNSIAESVHNNRVLLIEILEDNNFFKIVVEIFNRFEKVLVI